MWCALLRARRRGRDRKERERGTETARERASERASEKGRRACVVTRESEGSDYLRGPFFAPPLYIARRPTVRPIVSVAAPRRKPLVFTRTTRGRVPVRRLRCGSGDEEVVEAEDIGRRRGPRSSRLRVRVLLFECAAPRRDDGVKRARYFRRRLARTKHRSARNGEEGEVTVADSW